MAKVSAKKQAKPTECKAASEKPDYPLTRELIRATENYIFGSREITKEKAMRDAGYSPVTAKKQCQMVTQNALYREWVLAKSAEVAVTKGFINLRYLKKLIEPDLKWSEERGILQDLAHINGHWEKEVSDAPPVNIYQMLVGGDGDLADENALKERIDTLYPNSGRPKNRF